MGKAKTHPISDRKIRSQPPSPTYEAPQSGSGPQIRRRKQAMAAGLAGARHAGANVPSGKGWRRSK